MVVEHIQKPSTKGESIVYYFVLLQRLSTRWRFCFDYRLTKSLKLGEFLDMLQSGVVGKGIISAMDEKMLQLLVDLHIHHNRQGPGSEAAFRQALQLSGIDTDKVLHIADIGCGTGSSTIPLLQHTRADVVAVELLPEFLQQLVRRAEKAGVRDRVKTVEANMASLPFENEVFDVIWSEGAVYNIGFREGVREWRRFLKPGGMLVVSEITWLTSEVPQTLRTHWEHEYPQIAVASKKIKVLEKNGYVPVGFFILPPECWHDEYYRPLQAGFDSFLKRNKHSDAAKAVVEAQQKEIDLYQKYQGFVSYGFYIARKM